MKKLLSLALVTSLFSIDFKSVGFRAIGMGGAGVASSSGSNAIYYNPALLANTNYSTEISLSAGIEYRDFNLIDHIDKISKDNLTETLDRIIQHAPFSGTNSKEDRKNLIDAINQLKKIGTNNGMEASLIGGVGVQVKHFGIAIYNILNGVFKANVDTNHLSLIITKSGYYAKYDPYKDTYSLTNKEEYEKKSIQYALDNKLTFIQGKGFNLTELPIGYGFKMNDYLSIGGSFKLLHGITYKEKLDVDTDPNKLKDEIKKHQKDISTFGIDLGVLTKFNNLKIGMVGKNLNTPTFEFYDGEKIKLKPMIRGGMAFDIGSLITLAVDMDFTENKTILTGYKTKWLGGGIDFHQSWFSIRGGIKKNLANSNEGNILTAGFGLGLKWLQLDVAGEISTKKSKFDKNEIPRYGQINIALLSRWGGN